MATASSGRPHRPVPGHQAVPFAGQARAGDNAGAHEAGSATTAHARALGSWRQSRVATGRSVVPTLCDGH